MNNNHAHDQAKAQFEHIAALVAAYELDYDELESLQDQIANTTYAIEEAQDALEGTPENTDEYRTRRVVIDDLCTDLAHLQEDLAELQAIAAATGETFTDADTVAERIQEAPLSIETRSDWAEPGSTPEPTDFRILLCTGGPAVQIMGELDQYRQPCRAWVEYQDWGTPWTEYYDADQDTLLSFCQHFYFGE